MTKPKPGDGARHDEPNEYGFAGDPSLPAVEEPNRPDELDEAEEVAVPGDDFTEGLTESLEDTEDSPRPPGEAHPPSR